MDELLAILPAGGVVGDRKFVHSNHLYSVAALTDNSGNVVERYRYDAYGQRTVLAADGATTRAISSYGNQVGFTGRYLDKETGLWHFRTRMYSALLGRFIERMPWTTLIGSGQRTSFFLGKRRPKAILSEYAPLLVPNWIEFSDMLLNEGYGGYHQGRFNLYDFNKNDPANRLEPFSGSASSVQAAPPAAGEATAAAVNDALADLAAEMAAAKAYAAATVVIAGVSVVIAEILRNCLPDLTCMIGNACYLDVNSKQPPSEGNVGFCKKIGACCSCNSASP